MGPCERVVVTEKPKTAKELWGVLLEYAEAFDDCSDKVDALIKILQSE